jgi:hypothetical protein
MPNGISVLCELSTLEQWHGLTEELVSTELYVLATSPARLHTRQRLISLIVSISAS